MKTMHSSSLYVMHLEHVSIDCSCPPLNVVLAELVCLVPSAATALCAEQLSSELGIAYAMISPVQRRKLTFVSIKVLIV